MSKKKSQQSLIQRLWLKSQTKVLAYTQGSTAVGLGILTEIDGFTQTSRFKDLITNFHVPRWAWVSLLVISFLTWMAHGRSSDA